MIMVNGSGATMSAQFLIVRSVPGSDNRVTPAQADTVAHAAGLVGVCMSSATPNAFAVQVAPLSTSVPMVFASTPTIGNTAYLSETTAGQARDTAPAATGTNQIIPLGTIVHAIGTVGLVTPNPGALAAMAALGASAITSMTGDVAGTGPGATATTLTNIPQAVLLTRTGALTTDLPLNSRKITGLASGGATPTNAANIGDVQAAAAGLVSTTSHTAKSVLVSVAGTVSDQALAPLTLMGADGAGNLGAIPYSSVVSGGGGGLTLTSSAPADVDKSAAAVGTGTTAARSDHKHNISTAAPAAGAVAAGNTAVEGTATSLARSDHQHAVAVAAPVDVGTANAAGSATTLARSDHQHNVPFSAVSAALAAASSSISVNGQQITSVGTPTTSQAATNKAYVDGLLDGLRWKQPVLCASTTNVALSTGAQNGSLIDDITLTTGARFALRAQTAASENGLYTANASGAPTRSTDADTGAELVSCAFFVQQGTVNADKAFTCTNDAITIGTTGIVFTQFASAPSGALLAVNNLSDLANAATARSNLGLAAIAASGSASDLITGTVPAARLPNTAVTPGTYGDASHVSTVTVDATGRLTGASATPIAIAAGSVSGLAAIATSGSGADLTNGSVSAAKLSAVAPFTTLANTNGISGTPVPNTVAQMRTMFGLDVPQHYDLNLSFGIGDGNNSDSVIPSSVSIGAWAFYMNTQTITSQIQNAYAGAATDANLIFQEAMEWVTGGTFSKCEMYVFCWWFSAPGPGIFPAISVKVTRSGTKDTSPCTTNITGVGAFGVSPVAYAFGPTDGLGVVLQGNSGFANSGGQAKFSVHVRLTK